MLIDIEAMKKDKKLRKKRKNPLKSLDIASEISDSHFCCKR